MAVDSTSKPLLTISEKRLASIAYHAVGINTEGGPNPYTGPANAGGSSGITIGVMQNDFGQSRAKTFSYSEAIVNWNKASDATFVISPTTIANALEAPPKSGLLTPEIRTAIGGFGSTSEGAHWIYANFDQGHVNTSVLAAQQAFATPYGQAVLREGTHVEEFASFAMKIRNQYGLGTEGANGTAKSPGFGAFMDYLNDGSVTLLNNQGTNQTTTIVAGHPSEFNRGDLLSFARAYTDTRKKINEAVYTGPVAALNSGSLYKAILDSDSPLADVLKRVEQKGNFSPTLVGSDPDVAITRAMFGADTGRMKNAVVAINDDTTFNPVSVPVTLGQYLGTLWIDPMTERIALRYKGAGGGFVVGDEGYATFQSSDVVKVNGVSTLQIGEGNTKTPFDAANTPLANMQLTPVNASVIATGGHWEDTTQYDALGNVTVPGGRVFVPDVTSNSGVAASGITSKTPAPTESKDGSDAHLYKDKPAPSAKPTSKPTHTDGPTGDSIDSELPDGTTLVDTTVTVNGVTTNTVVLKSPDGQILLKAGPGETIVRDPETGIVTVRSTSSNKFTQYDPETQTTSTWTADGGMVGPPVPQPPPALNIDPEYEQLGLDQFFAPPTKNPAPTAQPATDATGATSSTGATNTSDTKDTPARERPNPPEDPTQAGVTDGDAASPFVFVNFKQVQIDGNLYDPNPNGTLNRTIPNSNGATESRDGTGGGVVIDRAGNTIAQLQPGDRVGVNDGGALFIRDASGKTVDRSIDDAPATTDHAASTTAVTTTEPTGTTEGASTDTFVVPVASIAVVTPAVGSQPALSLPLFDPLEPIPGMPSLVGSTAPAEVCVRPPEPATSAEGAVDLTAPAAATSEQKQPVALVTTAQPAIETIAPVFTQGNLNTYTAANTFASSLVSLGNWNNLDDAARWGSIASALTSYDQIVNQTPTTIATPGNPNPPNAQNPTNPGFTNFVNGVNTFASIAALTHWDQMSDLQRASALTRFAGSATQWATGGTSSGLNSFAGYLNLAQSVESGNTLGMVAGVNSVFTVSSGAVTEGVVDNALNSAIGSSGVPYVGIVLALNDFEHHPFQSIGSMVGMCFGPMGSMVGGIIGGFADSLFGGGGPPPPPPPPVGEVQYTWDAQGNITASVQQNVTGGGAVAASVGGNLLSSVLGAVDGHNEQVTINIAKNEARTPASTTDATATTTATTTTAPFTGLDITAMGIDPSRLPTVRYEFGRAWMDVRQPDGSVKTEEIKPETANQRILQIADQSGAIVPQWQAQTLQAHAQSGNTTPFVYDVKGNAAEAADHKTQNYGTLVVHLRSGNAAAIQQTLDEAEAAHAAEQANYDKAHGITPEQRAQANAAAQEGNSDGTHTVYRNIDNDEFLESGQWINNTDSNGAAQGVLVLDRDNNGVIDTADILNLGGNTGQAAWTAQTDGNQQRNNVAWMDANGDGVLDAHDPAFAAIRIWVDVNSDGRVDTGEMHGLQTIQLTGIDFKSGEVHYSNGQKDSLTTQTLSANTDGVKAVDFATVGADGKLVARKEAGTVIVHEGYEGQVWLDGKGKQLEEGAAGGHWEAKRVNSFDHIGKTTGDWEKTADRDLHRHGGGNVDGAPTATVMGSSDCYVVDSCSRTIFEGYRYFLSKSANGDSWRQVA